MIDEAALTKGQLRKLNTLRKSIGPAIADEAFSKWLDRPVEEPGTDKNAEVISNALWGLIERHPRAGARIETAERAVDSRVLVVAPRAGGAD